MATTTSPKGADRLVAIMLEITWHDRKGKDLVVGKEGDLNILSCGQLFLKLQFDWLSDALQIGKP